MRRETPLPSQLAVNTMIDILVIDDELVVREGVCRVCESIGLTTEAVGDAKTGLEKLRKRMHRLIVCDIMLPDRDGFHILNAMKEWEINAPVIMITGCSTLQNAVNSLREGAVEFIPKPFTMEELESTIRRGLQYQSFLEALPGPGSTSAGTLFRPCPRDFYRLGRVSWVKMEPNGIAILGVTELFLKTIGQIVELRLLDVGQELAQAAPCGTILAQENLPHEILSPVSGTIVERNETLLSRLSMLEESPYSEGWLYRIVPANVSFELEHLVNCTNNP